MHIAADRLAQICRWICNYTLHKLLLAPFCTMLNRIATVKQEQVGGGRTLIIS